MILSRLYLGGTAFEKILRLKMLEEEAKVALFDELLACVIQSSHAMEDTANALVFDPLHSARVILLNDSLDSTRVLLSKVFIHPSSYRRFPPLTILKGNREN
jgi:hypothetical protein